MIIYKKGDFVKIGTPREILRTWVRNFNNNRFRNISFAGEMGQIKKIDRRRGYPYLVKMKNWDILVWINLIRYPKSIKKLENVNCKSIVIL